MSAAQGAIGSPGKPARPPRRVGVTVLRGSQAGLVKRLGARMTLPGAIHGTSTVYPTLLYQAGRRNRPQAAIMASRGHTLCQSVSRLYFPSKSREKGPRPTRGDFVLYRPSPKGLAAILRKPQPGLVKRLVAHWYLYKKAQEGEISWALNRQKSRTNLFSSIKTMVFSFGANLYFLQHPKLVKLFQLQRYSFPTGLLFSVLVVGVPLVA